MHLLKTCIKETLLCLWKKKKSLCKSRGKRIEGSFLVSLEGIKKSFLAIFFNDVCYYDFNAFPFSLQCSCSPSANDYIFTLMLIYASFIYNVKKIKFYTHSYDFATFDSSFLFQRATGSNFSFTPLFCIIKEIGKLLESLLLKEDYLPDAMLKLLALIFVCNNGEKQELYRKH